MLMSTLYQQCLFGVTLVAFGFDTAFAAVMSEPTGADIVGVVYQQKALTGPNILADIDERLIHKTVYRTNDRPVIDLQPLLFDLGGDPPAFRAQAVDLPVQNRYLLQGRFGFGPLRLARRQLGLLLT